MNRFLLCAVILSSLATDGQAQNPDCRQSWMPPDAPAFCAWENEPSLSEARAYPAVATSGTSIYVLGGFRFDAASGQVIYYDSAVRSTINTNGHLDSWTAEPSFKSARSGAAAAVASGCAFLAGGSSSTPTSLTYYDDVQIARIASNGHLSAWTTSPKHLRVPRSNLTLVPVTTPQGTFLNAVAGVAQIGQDTVHLDTIEVAKIGNGCELSDWTVADYHLKGGRSTPQAVSVRNNVVVVGGWGDLDLIDVYDDVQVTANRPDGSPAPWRTVAGRLPTGIYGHATTVAEGSPSSVIFSIAGQPGTGAYANWISYSYVAAAGNVADAIGIWRIAPSGRLPTGRAGLSAVSYRGRLYVLGGADASGQYYRDVLSARFDVGRPY